LPSGDSTAFVFAPSASLPLPCSVRAYAATHSPVASFGRYFAFCASLPNQTMGSVPMPTCAPKVTDHEPCWLIASAKSSDVVLSRPSPP